MYDDLPGVLAVVPRVASDYGHMIAVIVAVPLRLVDGVPAHSRHAGQLIAGVVSVVSDVGAVGHRAEGKWNVLDADAHGLIFI